MERMMKKGNKEYTWKMTGKKVWTEVKWNREEGRGMGRKGRIARAI